MNQDSFSVIKIMKVTTGSDKIVGNIRQFKLIFLFKRHLGESEWLSK
jgi:hypothetical protein